MGKITFILGGARSGKSTYALELAKKYKRVAFIATCEPKDREMRKRIALHKKSRPAHWKTFEEPRDVPKVLENISKSYDCVIIDCVTLLASNIILSRAKEALIKDTIARMLAILKKNKGRALLISNEVGLGIVPASKLGRQFRDIAGSINQTIAREANEVFFMVSGISWKIK